MALILESKYLAANLDNPRVVILDTRCNIPYHFGHNQSTDRSE
jgi:predicted sulfurtransferase